MCRPTEEEVGPTVGLPTPLTFRRALLRACPCTDTGQTFLRLFQETAPFQSPFTTHIGMRMTYSRLKPNVSPRGTNHSIWSNNHPSATANKAINCLKMMNNDLSHLNL